jgi:putative ABC transport system substrate-binding protein
MIRRRTFISLLGGTAAGSAIGLRAARAQQPGKVWRVGYLGLSSTTVQAVRMDALRAGLRDLGYTTGKNLVIEERWADSRYDQLAGLAANLVRANVDVIVTHGTPGVLAARGATSTIPIVIAAVGSIPFIVTQASK